MSDNLRVFGGPGRYVQGAGAIDAMGRFLQPLGASAVLIADRPVLDLVGARVVKVCADVGVRCEPVEFSGEITLAEIARVADVARGFAPAFVIGAGGGRGIDTGKAVADRLGARVVTLPTAASNDAPTSKLYAVYDERHRLVQVDHMAASPDVVVVDTAVIVTAPVRMFSAGIGDAVVKRFEVAQCFGVGARNMFGGTGCRAAEALAELCYDTLRSRGVAAIEAVRRREVTEDVERVVEATVLHSGLGFESGGLSIAHAMTRGLSAVRGARDALHGHQVAYALLVQLALEGRDQAFVGDLATFYRATDLPLSLTDLGMPDATDDEIDEIAAGTMTAPHARNFQRTLSAADIAGAMRSIAR